VEGSSSIGREEKKDIFTRYKLTRQDGFTAVVLY